MAVSSNGRSRTLKRKTTRRGTVKSNLPFRGAQHTHIRYVIALSYSPHFSDIHWHINNILITPPYCHLSPGTVDDQYMAMNLSVFEGYLAEEIFILDIIRHESLNSRLYAHFVDHFRFVLSHFIRIFAEIRLWYLLYNKMNSCKIIQVIIFQFWLRRRKVSSKTGQIHHFWGTFRLAWLFCVYYHASNI